MTVLGCTISPAFAALVMAEVTWFDAGVKAKRSGHLSPRSASIVAACAARGRNRNPRGVLIMNSLILCTAVTLNIFSAPAGNQVVGAVPVNKEVQLMDGSLLRDWVFIGKPGPDGVSPRGWVIYAGLGQCQ
jgi:hypothetical protein